MLMQVLLDNTSPVQKRTAAYLVLMKNPKPSELDQIVNAMSLDHHIQVRSFINSHIRNIMSSTEPETEQYVERSVAF